GRGAPNTAPSTAEETAYLAYILNGAGSTSFELDVYVNTYNSKEEVVETPVDLADQLGTAVGLRRVNNDRWWLLYGDTMYIKNGTSS
ncbi:hypothetical protein, partial [Halomonas marinisediminis]|uniref:hypothetical protein n=1 Tax=Halomonas marinisediminis TaxID=2546095 RepID=UPI00197AE408